MSADSTTFRRSRVFNASRDHLRAITFRGNLRASTSKPEYQAAWQNAATGITPGLGVRVRMRQCESRALVPGRAGFERSRSG